MSFKQQHLWFSQVSQDRTDWVYHIASVDGEEVCFTHAFEDDRQLNKIELGKPDAIYLGVGDYVRKQDKPL